MTDLKPSHIQIQLAIIDRCKTFGLKEVLIRLSPTAQLEIMKCKQSEMRPFFDGVQQLKSDSTINNGRVHFKIDESLREGFDVSEFNNGPDGTP